MPVAGTSQPPGRCSLGCSLRNVVSWSVTIDGCVKCGEHREALVLFEMMENAASTAMEEEGGGLGAGGEAVRANSVIMAIVLGACAACAAGGRRAWEEGCTGA